MHAYTCGRLITVFLPFLTGSFACGQFTGVGNGCPALRRRKWPRAYDAFRADRRRFTTSWFFCLIPSSTVGKTFCAYPIDDLLNAELICYNELSRSLIRNKTIYGLVLFSACISVCFYHCALLFFVPSHMICRAFSVSFFSDRCRLPNN